MLKALFRLHVRDSIERGEENDESTIVKVSQNAWTNGILEMRKRVDQNIFEQHVKYFATTIWDKLFQL